MAKFRKKPVVIEAWQWQKNAAFIDLPEWLQAQCLANEAFMVPGDLDHLFIRTLEGVMRASPGDWIIQGVKGEVYPCKPDIFSATYEAVDS